MTMADASANKELFDSIRAYLSGMELGDLFSTDANGAPAGWLWEQITSGVDNAAALQIALEQTSQFQRRYGIIAEMRAQAATGAAVHVPTVAEVREYEQRTTQLMRQAGLPSYMFDNWADTHALLRNNLSVAEVEQRLGQAWERVTTTDPQVREAFNEFYGIEGDAALAAMFLDPTRTMSALEKQSRAAYTAGTGRAMGLTVDQQLAERFANLPKTEAGINETLGQLNALDKSGIMSETMGESALDLTLETTGIDSVLDNNGAANQAIERRIIERQANRAAVPGGAIRTQTGLTGAGSAR